MNNQDWGWWKDFRNEKKQYLTNDEYKIICELHAKYFEHKVNYPCKCSPKVIQKYIDDLNEFYSSNPKPKIR
tara:strand:- start:136 stop:351 length:216 start_codon:yes stop_codon:yes gene_type:complete